MRSGEASRSSSLSHFRDRDPCRHRPTLGGQCWGGARPREFAAWARRSFLLPRLLGFLLTLIGSQDAFEKLFRAALGVTRPDGCRPAGARRGAAGGAGHDSARSRVAPERPPRHDPGAETGRPDVPGDRPLCPVRRRGRRAARRDRPPPLHDPLGVHPGTGRPGDGPGGDEPPCAVAAPRHRSGRCGPRAVPDRGAGLDRGNPALPSIPSPPAAPAGPARGGPAGGTTAHGHRPRRLQGGIGRRSAPGGRSLLPPHTGVPRPAVALNRGACAGHTPRAPPGGRGDDAGSPPGRAATSPHPPRGACGRGDVVGWGGRGRIPRRCAGAPDRSVAPPNQHRAGIPDGIRRGGRLLPGR